MFSFDPRKHKPIIKKVIALSNIGQRQLQPGDDYLRFLREPSSETSEQLDKYLCQLDFESLKVLKALMVIGRDNSDAGYVSLQAALNSDYEEEFSYNENENRLGQLRNYLAGQHRSLHNYLELGCNKAGIEL